MRSAAERARASTLEAARGRVLESAIAHWSHIEGDGAAVAGVADDANVVVTTGSADGIGLVARAMLNPGDVVIVYIQT